jgi:alkylhydroperoxidase/carboxymuconolactone decarboxylase family protein YurZ
MATDSGDAPVLTLLAQMTEDSLEATSLDDQSVMLVRLAALVAVDAPAASYLLNLGAAGATGVDADQVQGLLAAVAPIVGTPRVVAAASNMVKAFDLKLDLADLSAGE